MNKILWKNFLKDSTFEKRKKKGLKKSFLLPPPPNLGRNHLPQEVVFLHHSWCHACLNCSLTHSLFGQEGEEGKMWEGGTDKLPGD